MTNDSENTIAWVKLQIKIVKSQYFSFKMFICEVTISGISMNICHSIALSHRMNVNRKFETLLSLKYKLWWLSWVVRA